MTRPEIKAAEQARAALGTPPGADADVLRAAFQRMVKVTHPDRGGDPEAFRRVLDAYRLLKAQTDRPAAVMSEAAQPVRTAEQAAEPDGALARPVLKISVADAFLGGSMTITLKGGARGKVRLPPGLRSGDVVRFGPGGAHSVSILISPDPGAEVRGDDLWLTVPVSADFLQSGGRLEAHTPFGQRHFLISRTSAARGLFRAPGEGLPATDARPRGQLYLRLKLDPGMAPTSAKSLLARFAASWAA